ncbi:MAG: hypothetical protein HY673_04095 [Chloroflexi bacterium]|nr:hypothetical protein [Chloroflexota bacterium]
MSLEEIRDGVTGWRGKLGWVSPAVPYSSSLVDVHSVIPDGIEILIATLGITAITDEQAQMALSRAYEAAARLATAGAGFVSVDGAPLVCTRGFGFDKEIIKNVEQAAKIPATTDLTAAVDALRALKLRRIAMASPLPDAMNAKIRKFMEDSGFEVASLNSLNITFNRDIHALPQNAAYGAARKAYMEAAGAEGIYIPCGAWCPAWVVRALEADLGVPVVHSRQATTWAGLKALKIREPVTRWGRLFQTLYA